jgi:hypothetical protein
MPYKDPKIAREKRLKWEASHKPEMKEYLADYYKKNRKEALEYYATHRERARDRKLKRVFGITLGEFRVLSESQNDLCAICNKKEIIPNRSLCVDHDHTTGKIRGLLCYKCNVMIGMSNESIQIMENALTYLKKHGN